MCAKIGENWEPLRADGRQRVPRSSAILVNPGGGAILVAIVDQFSQIHRGDETQLVQALENAFQFQEDSILSGL